MTIGFLLCILPGLAVALVTPVFVNRIFVADLGISEAFAQSFQVVYLPLAERLELCGP